jgi:hypothetical protein
LTPGAQNAPRWWPIQKYFQKGGTIYAGRFPDYSFPPEPMRPFRLMRFPCANGKEPAVFDGYPKPETFRVALKTSAHTNRRTLHES